MTFEKIKEKMYIAELLNKKIKEFGIITGIDEEIISFQEKKNGDYKCFSSNSNEEFHITKKLYEELEKELNK